MIVVGILIILAGAGCAMFGLVYGLALIAPDGAAEMYEDMPFDYEKWARVSYISYGIVYGLFGAGLIWLGIGSVMIKRWAARLLHALGWVTIGLAVVQSVSMLLFIPMMLQVFDLLKGLTGSSPMPGGAGAIGVVIIVIYAIIILLMAGGPGLVLVLVYGRKNVELTTLHFDPKASWTDVTSYRVLILWLLILSSLGWMLLSTIAFGPLIAEIGLFPDTKLLNIWSFGSIGILAILLYGVGKAKLWSWWVALISGLVGFGFSYWLFQSIDLNEFISQFAGENWLTELADGDDDDEAEMLLQFFNLAEKGIAQYIVLSTALGAMLFIGLMIWIKKDFGSRYSENTSVATEEG